MNEYEDDPVGKHLSRLVKQDTQTKEEYFESLNTNFSIFDFKFKTYKGFKDKKGKIIVEKLVNCKFELLNSIVDDLNKESLKTKFRIKISTQKSSKIIKFSSEEITQINLFKTRLIAIKIVFFGDSKDLTLLIDTIFKQNFDAPEIRELSIIGYDKVSDCFVFPEFLYDTNGIRKTINGHKYFETHNIMPPQNEIAVINKLKATPINKLLDVLFKAHNYRGLAAMGFWTASLFSHLIFKEYGFFPFFSMYGDSRCGKTDLTRLLNRCFFLDWEGISMTKANTQKYELRKISQKASLVVPMIEGRTDNSKFDYDAVLPLYNRNAMAGRAKTTQDNETHELPFNATLAFVQNREQFVSKPAKERVVSIKFLNSDLNDETYASWQELNKYRDEELASIGDFILTNRKQFEDTIINEIQDAIKTLKYYNDKIPGRIADNHGIIAGALKCFFKIANLEVSPLRDFFSYISQIAKDKFETARETNDIADLFFEQVNSLPQTSDKGIIIDKEKNEIKLHLATIFEIFTWHNKTELLNALKRHERFIKDNVSIRINGEVKKFWVFKIE